MSEVARPWIGNAIVVVPEITTGPRIVIAVPPVLIRSLSLATRTAAKRRRTIVIAVARPCSRLAPVIFTIAVVRGAATSGAGFVGAPLVVARVVVARVKIHRRATLSVMDPLQLLAEALRLSDGERAALAGELIQSLDSEVDPDAEAAWSAEIRARLERVDAGTATTISWAEARRRIHAAGRAPRA
jgi:putative addiction module component (TIGR02574 family)